MPAVQRGDTVALKQAIEAAGFDFDIRPGAQSDSHISVVVNKGNLASGAAQGSKLSEFDLLLYAANQVIEPKLEVEDVAPVVTEAPKPAGVPVSTEAPPAPPAAAAPEAPAAPVAPAVSEAPTAETFDSAHQG